MSIARQKVSTEKNIEAKCSVVGTGVLYRATGEITASGKRAWFVLLEGIQRPDDIMHQG
jgi:hypothetical protein